MISFDLDMTLLDHGTWEIPASAVKALNCLRGRHKIVIATGRDMDNKYSTVYRDFIQPDAIIHMNGTKITVGNQLVFEHLFDKRLLKELLGFCEQRGYGIGMTIGDEDFYISSHVIASHDNKRWGCSDRNFKDPWMLMDMDVRTLAFIGNEQQAKDVERHFPGLRLPMFAGKQGADVIEKGISKADGLRFLASYFGEKEDLSDTVAFGDSMNDLEILQAAGIGIAMGNAIEELKAAADYVTDSISQDGVWNALFHFGLISGDGDIE